MAKADWHTIGRKETYEKNRREFIVKTIFKNGNIKTETLTTGGLHAWLTYFNTRDTKIESLTLSKKPKP